MGEIADWHPGYVVWEYLPWKWMMDQGVKITMINVVDYRMWAEQGIEGLKNLVTEKEFNFYQKESFDLKSDSMNIHAAFSHPNFTFINRELTWNDITEYTAKEGICDVTLNGRMLDKKDGFTIHRVVILDVSEDEVICHDPEPDDRGAYRKVRSDHFWKCVDDLADPQLTHYSRADW